MSSINYAKLCELWKYHGADDEGSYQTCEKVIEPKMMIQCDGNKNKCELKARNISLE